MTSPVAMTAPERKLAVNSSPLISMMIRGRKKEPDAYAINFNDKGM